MAKSSGGGMGGILKIALLAGGGYYLYSRMTAPAAAAPAGATPAAGGSSSLDAIVAAVQSALSSSSSTPAVGTPTAPASSSGLVAELKLAAKGNALFSADGKGIPDYWMYYRNQLHPPAVNLPAQFTNTTAQITAEDFVAGLQSAGLAGLGAVPVILPKRMTIAGRTVLVVPAPGVEVNAEAVNHLRQRRGVRVLA